MRRSILISAFFVFGALVFHPAPARAGMHFCNKTANTVNVAMATDYLMYYHVWGWWQVGADSCRAVISADLDTTGDTSYYYYAYATAGGTWTGDSSFCIDPNYAFDLNDEQEGACITGAHRDFKTISTHDESDFTVSLLP